MQVEGMKAELKNIVRSYIMKDELGKYKLSEINKLPISIVGPPGVGKTQVVREVAEELEIGFVSTSITHHTRNTILGLPVVTELEKNDGKKVKYTKYTMSEILADVWDSYEKGNREGILLLDEFASMADSLQAPMLAFLQTKNIGDYVLPEGWIIVLCSNPREYNNTAKEFDAAIMDRVRLINVEFALKDFLNYGRQRGIHNTILEYLKLKKNHAYVCDKKSHSLVTARGWENLSFCLKSYEELELEISEELIRQFIKDNVVASSFYQFYITYGKELPTNLISNILQAQDIHRYVTMLRQRDMGTKWMIMNSMANLLEQESEVYAAEIKRYFGVRGAYDYLRNCQTITPGTWDVMEVLKKRASAVQAFTDDMEQKIFGSVKPDAEEKELYEKIVRKAIQKSETQPEEDQKESEETEKGRFKNEIILDSMKEESEAYRNKLCNKMQTTNQKVTNVIHFLQHIEAEEEKYVDAFVECISSNTNVLNMLALCPNKAYANVIQEIHGIWRKNAS